MAGRKSTTTHNGPPDLPDVLTNVGVQTEDPQPPAVPKAMRALQPILLTGERTPLPDLFPRHRLQPARHGEASAKCNSHRARQKVSEIAKGFANLIEHTHGKRTSLKPKSNQVSGTGERHQPNHFVNISIHGSPAHTAINITNSAAITHTSS